MKTFREFLRELETVSSTDKTQLNEDARQETVQYITKMKEAFSDMEGDELEEMHDLETLKHLNRKEEPSHNEDLQSQAREFIKAHNPHQLELSSEDIVNLMVEFANDVKGK